MQQPTLETARLVLRPFMVTDAPTVQRLAGVFAVADTTLNIPHPYPDGVAEAWIATHPGHFAARTAVIFAMMLREPSALCGSISLGITEHHLHAELGYWLGQPYWNRGYTTEAAAAVLSYGFTMLGLHRIHARHFTRNPASGRVMQKLGMRREGIQRAHVRKGDRFEDLVPMGSCVMSGHVPNARQPRLSSARWHVQHGTPCILPRQWHGAAYTTAGGHAAVQHCARLCEKSERVQGPPRKS